MGLYRGRLGQRRNSREFARACAEAPAAADCKGRISLILSQTSTIMVAHASTRATQLYDRRPDEMSLDEVERILV